uniref:Uncharacterized protein n=1 Tax=Podospora anserina (strain S / ATCC MYA-4624 / DSM 980 / FGSC 10383) TaxID=515849 RepID=A0A090D9P5_PODAN|nr:Putative protein of unknown function [Podospora anserina S mat+]
MTTPTLSRDDLISLHGFTPLPVDQDAIFQGKPFLHQPTPVPLSSIPYPSSTDPLVAKVQEYAKEKLPIQTYNHSMRVFYWCTPLHPFPLHHSPDLSPPRHRHHPLQPILHPPLIRVPRRGDSPRPPKRTQRQQVASRSRSRSHNPTPRPRHSRHHHSLGTNPPTSHSLR